MREVLLTKKATLKFREMARWWSENRSAEQAARWYNGFLGAIESLDENPERCQIAPKNALFPIEMRELHYGLGRRTTHRAVFAIRPDRVVIYTIRHHAQKGITLEDL